MKKHFFKVNPDDKGQRKDVANQMFAALKKDIARNKVLDDVCKDPEPPERQKK